MNGENMTLRHMKIFIRVYQLENITRAARELCMTQPAVTRAIQEIEGYYGVRLFERMNRRLYVTETGKLFYTYALHIVDSFDQMEKGLRNWDELGVLRVGASITIGNALLPKAIVAFRREHPGLQIQATISNGTKLHQLLLDNRLDFALIEGGISDEQLKKEVFASDRLVLILAPGDPRVQKETLFLKELKMDSFILREEGSMGRTLVNHVFERHEIPLTPVIESASTQAIIRCVHEGLGLSFLPEQLVRSSVRSGFVATKEIQDEKFGRDYYVVWHKQKFLTRSARELIKYFRHFSSEQTLV